jgi:hypothetical protein
VVYSTATIKAGKNVASSSENTAPTADNTSYASPR